VVLSFIYFCIAILYHFDIDEKDLKISAKDSNRRHFVVFDSLLVYLIVSLSYPLKIEEIA